MDIHKPKPWHDWRDFLKEFGTIVLGVSVALAAEQGVEWWHWEHRVANARAAVVLELRDDAGPQAFTRMALGECLNDQLNGLQDAIEAGQSRAAINALIDDYKVPIRTWETTAWNALLGSDVAAHIPPERMILWASPYIYVPRLAAYGEQEGKDYFDLRPARRAGERLTDAEADAMLATVAHLRRDNRYMRRTSSGVLISMRRNGIEVTQEQQHRILEGLRAHFKNCVVTPSITLLDENDNTSFLNRKRPAR